MLKSGIYLTLLVWCFSVSGTIIYPTRGNHRTCKTLICSYGTVCVQKVRYCLTSPCIQPKPTCEVAEVERSDSCALLNCPQGTKCKQEVRQCVSPPCQQPPPTCIRVSTPSHPTLCPPGLNPDLRMGRTKNCVSDGQCGSGSKCFSANVHGPFICCSEKPAQATLPSQPQYNYPQPHQHHMPASQLAIQPLQHPGQHQNPPIPRVKAQQHGINHKQPPPTHYQHGPPNQPIVQQHRQPMQQLPSGQVRHHTLSQPQAKPYAFMNHHPSQNFHRSRNIQPPQYQTRQQEYNINQPYLQSEPINQPQSYTQRETVSRRYPDPWSRQQREPEVEIANPRTAEIEVRRAPSGYGPPSSQNCPVGHIPDFQRGREIPCIQDAQCQSGSHCMSGTGRRYVCCAKETSGLVHQRPVKPMPTYSTNRQQIVSYGNRRPAPRLSFPLPAETLPVVNDSPHRQHSTNQQWKPDRISFNSQYSPKKQPNLPYRMPGSNMQQQQQPKKKSVSGQMQVTCPSGYTANQVNGQNMVCASGSQCPEGSECKSTGLFQGSICCSKSTGMGQNMGYRPRR
ncbi:hypothetical protein LOTGIDRAFT_228882 [Lottia gigantea]|uniref:EB domain-containing protein n=1 Tax=Lottia gigantea TaxID=225164 RepID=V4A6M7_LOTGI|nr:hypothetical protein LOTGIDRAFT_228882 [Lottia gigantea]ESO88911.1 hypothetical protein LOTGIDRAFT_228882 [Lottia gigantea]